MVGQYIKDSKVVEDNFYARFIDLSTSLTIDEIGKNPIIKITRYVKIIFKIVSDLIYFQPNIVYLAITAKGIGFCKDFPIALLVKLFGKKLVLHYHNKGVANYQDKPLYNRLYKILFKNSKVILLSKNLYSDISKYVTKENVFFCPNGIPVEEYSKNNYPLPKNSTPQLLFLSNLIESKGIYILLEALEILKNQGLKFHCNLIGGEGDISNNQLNIRLKNQKLDNCVTYLGKKYNDEKWSVFLSSDAFVFPTYYHNECFPLVLLEAMMFGLPIISTCEGGIPEIINHHETGFIVERQNSIELAERIKFIIENPELAKQMGKKARNQFLQSFTLEVFENNLVNILNQI